MARFRTKQRWFSSLVAAGYLLVIAAAPLFHNHSAGGCDHSFAAESGSAACPHHGDSHDAANENSSHRPSPHPSDGNHCAVCQFLAQKPAPVAEVAIVDNGLLVQELASPAPTCAAVGVFSAWQSRAPPCLA
jgi:hypothetical protein